MGQKISVNFLRARKRLPNNDNASATHNELQKSVWFANGRDYSKLMLQDFAIKDYLRLKLKDAGLVEIIIRRFFKKIEISIFTTKPGIIIGRQGSSINELRTDVTKRFGLKTEVKLDIQEVKDTFLSAVSIAYELGEAIKKGMPYRRLAKTFMEKAKMAGNKGIKLMFSGRINGSDIARTETLNNGAVPRHTIDSNIDYALNHCQTKSGIMGIKVWLYKGNKYDKFNNN
jgi:small subunit ribosomal protein S3